MNERTTVTKSTLENIPCRIIISPLKTKLSKVFVPSIEIKRLVEGGCAKRWPLIGWKKITIILEAAILSLPACLPSFP